MNSNENGDNFDKNDMTSVKLGKLYSEGNNENDVEIQNSGSQNVVIPLSTSNLTLWNESIVCDECSGI